MTCFYDYQIGHVRDGYFDKWYEQENDDGTIKVYEFQPMKKLGDIYITVETYF